MVDQILEGLRPAPRPSEPAIANTVAGAPTTDAELAEYLRDTFGIVIPDTVVCPHHSTPFRAFADAYFARHSVTVWNASRGFGGKTFILSLLSLAEAHTLRAKVNLLGGSGEQAKRVLEAMNSFWNYPRAPRAQLATAPAQRETRFRAGNWVRALMASTASARGPHPQRLRLDEVDEMTVEILDAAMGQTMSLDGVPAQTVLSSTHHYADGTFQEVKRRAADRGWPVHVWCVAADTIVSTPNGERRVSTLQRGDQVYSWEGDRFVAAAIEAAWSNGVKRTIRVITDGGAIECTPDHQLLTDRGWREAGRLRPSDRLLSMQSSDPGEQEQDGPVLEVLPDGVPSEATGDGESDHLRVREAEAGPFGAMPALLSGGDGEEEHRQSRSLDDGEGDEPRKAPVLVGAASRGGVHRVGDRLQSQLSDRSIRGGLLPSGDEDRGRGLWPIASEMGRCDRARQGSRARGGSCWIPTGDPLRPQYASVVAIVDGRDIDVWDLSVPGLHNFVANGLIAHNCYRECLEPHGWLSPSEVGRKRAEVTDAMWQAEYEGQEPNPEGRAIVPEKVEAMFKPSLGRFTGADGEYIEIEPPQHGEYQPIDPQTRKPIGPVRRPAYAHASDWARKQDRTAIWTFRTDVAPMRLVAFERMQRLPWPVMVKKFDDRVKRYGGAAAHDATGIGDVVDGYITVSAEAVILVGRERADTFSEYIAAIERGDCEAPMIESVYGAHKFASTDDLYGAGHPPDEFVAGALAYRAATRSARVSVW